MKKSMLCFALAAVFCMAALSGCKPASQTTTTTAQTTTAATTTTAAAEETTTAQADEELTENEKIALEENLTKMIPVMDSIARSMAENQIDVPYSSEDPEFFWNVLCAISNNFAAGYEGIELVGAEIKVPVQVMQLFASAAFYDYDDLLPIPESRSMVVSYDESKDVYMLMGSDMSQSISLIDDYVINDDGSIQLTLGIYNLDEDENTAATPGYQVKYTLVENPYGHVDENMALFYSVTQAELTFIPG